MSTPEEIGPSAETGSSGDDSFDQPQLPQDGVPTHLVFEALSRRLDELKTSLESDSVPDSVVAAAKASYGWRSVDDDLARLQYDSLLDTDLPTSVRTGSQDRRFLTFKAEKLVLDVEVMMGSNRSLTCQVVPPQVAELEVRHRGGVMHVGSDELGSFHVLNLPNGPISLRCVPSAAGSTPAATSWVTL